MLVKKLKSKNTGQDRHLFGIAQLFYSGLPTDDRHKLGKVFPNVAPGFPSESEPN